MSRSSAWVSVMDLFGGIEVMRPRGTDLCSSCEIRHSTNDLVSKDF
jgi:hypothetical protein